MSQTESGGTNPIFTPKPDRAPPAITVGVIGWLRTNLFSSWVNTLLTFAGIGILYLIIPGLLNWAVFDAHFVGEGREACKPNFEIIKDPITLKGELPDGSFIDIETTADRVFVPEGVVPNMRWTNKLVERTAKYKGRQYAKILVQQDVVIYGACWIFIGVRFDQFIYGFYPKGERWRPTLAIGLGLLLIFYMLTDRMPKRGWAAVILFLPYPVFAYWLFAGGLGLVEVDNSKWGGLLLTIIISAVAIAGALPLGIAIALGRRSKMPILRYMCIIFIEFLRAVPLITILFMAMVILPLFLPPGTSFDQLLRILIMTTLFIAAYTAEVVRGGLAALPRGQFEAADALGLSYWKTMALIILPQALKVMIPAIVSLFIGIFKDTTLVQIVGLNDLLTMVQFAFADAKWVGLSTEGYAFCALIFFIFCFSMSQYSMYLERKLHTGH